MKRFIALTAVLLLVFLCGCSVQAGTSFLPADVDYAKDLGTDTPEGLAKTCSDLYAKMVSGELAPADGFDQLLSYMPADTAGKMAGVKEQFEKEIASTIDYFSANSDGIDRFEFSKTDYKGDTEASIYRIQHQKSGKSYYFVQDFVKENGVWKVKGDNISDPFTLKKKFLFWYL